MKIMLRLSLGLSLALFASSAFSQQPPFTEIISESEVVSPDATGTREGLAESTIDAAHDPQYGLHRFPDRGGKLDWGLALSGGGIRSAAFSLGAMKALYDKGYMAHIDVISSVSGGGYISYWLFTNYKQNKDGEFGTAAFSNKNFIRNVCRLQMKGRSNLVQNKKLVKILSKKLIGRREQAFRDYQTAIEGSFGNDIQTNTQLNFLENEIGNKHVPYFIINTTLEVGKKDKKKAPELRKRSSTVFEITPHFRGNPAIGFIDWTEKDKDGPTLSKSIAMSGAPHLFGPVGIEGKIRNSHDAIAGSNLTLTDGGHSENLGALALIRRGIKNVIIVDAEADPAYKFDAYLKLKKMLADEMKINFCVPDIEWFLGKQCNIVDIGIAAQKGDRKVFSPKTISEGKARGANGSIDTHIYYVKMSLPQAILPEIFSEVDDDEGKCDVITRGQEIERVRECQLCSRDSVRAKKGCMKREKIWNCDCSKKKLDCGRIKLELDDKAYAQLYANIVWHYSRYLNKPKPSNPKIFALKWMLNPAGDLCYLVSKPRWFEGGKVRDFCSLLTYNFPHVTTLDQSFFSDQMEAFVGLGYLQTMMLKKRPDQ